MKSLESQCNTQDNTGGVYTWGQDVKDMRNKIKNKTQYDTVGTVDGVSNDTVHTHSTQH